MNSRSSDASGRTREHGYCEVHKKRAYPSRKRARQASRVLHAGDAGVRPYRCDHIDGAWHLGHLPDVVRKRGVVSADAIFDASYRQRNYTHSRDRDSDHDAEVGRSHQLDAGDEATDMHDRHMGWS